METDWTSITQFTPHSSTTKWRIHWHNSTPTLISEDGRFYNTCRFEGESLLFYRDLTLGHIERVALELYGNIVRVVIRKNTTKFDHSDWALVDMFDASWE